MSTPDKATPAPAAADAHPGETLEQPIPADPIATPAPAPAAAAVKLTVEEWARAKGMLPEFHEREDPRNPKRLRPKAKPLLVHNKAHAPYAAAKVSLQWPIGKELTEAEFDKAIALNGGAPVEGVTQHVYR